MERWLRCKVLPGMFSHEWLVVIEDPGRGEIASIFVDATLVRTRAEPRRNDPVPEIARSDRAEIDAAVVKERDALHDQ